MRIEDYAFLSDTETSALVGRDGSVDWLCLPRFDSPACFAKLLGTEENGYWRIAPADPILATRRSYREGTLILDTEFTTGSGRVRVTDFMPIRDEHPDFIRVVEGLDGEVPLKMKLALRFDCGRTIPWVRQEESGLVAVAGPNAILLQSDVKTHGEDHSTAAEFTVKAGERIAFVLTWFPSHLPVPKPVRSEDSLKRTTRFWRDWSGHCQPAHQWSEAVKKSLLVLKGLTYAPTGGIVAAATTSLPEQLGGGHNWDYRFCWLRDATFTLTAFLDAGYTEEAAAWRDWLLRAAAGSPDQLQVLYGVAGEKDLTEIEWPHLAGYEGTQPVRTGNAAANQFQLDIYGEVIDTIQQASCAGIKPDDWSWPLQTHLVDYVSAHWREPDDGIWEVRGGRRLFTHSRMMAWVALDRAVKGVERQGLKGDVARWRNVRDEIHREICARGFNADRRAFTQSFDCTRLDASLLMMPLVGFLPATDPRVRSTIEAIERELMADGFIYRYRRDDAPSDALSSGEGAFLPCTFWFVDCLNLLGRRDEAVDIFERLLAIRNDLGLLAEEYDPIAKRQLGNFPQAFSHVGLVNTASNLGEMKGHAAQRREEPST